MTQDDNAKSAPTIGSLCLVPSEGVKDVEDIERLRGVTNCLLEAARKAAAVIPKVADPSIAEAQEAFFALVTAIHKAESEGKR